MNKNSLLRDLLWIIAATLFVFLVIKPFLYQKEGVVVLSKNKKEERRHYDNPDKFAEYFKMISQKDQPGSPQYKHGNEIREIRKADALLKTFKSAQANLPWVERGPGNCGGRTRAIVVDPDVKSASTWYVGSVGGGLWKTINSGVTWLNMYAEMQNLSIGCLAMAPSNHDVMYAGTGEGFYNSDRIEGNGIVKTTDRGNTWSFLISTQNGDFNYVNRIIINPSDENQLLAATNGGILKSDDGGVSWDFVFRSSTTCTQIVANPLDFNTQYATFFRKKIAKSTDGGKNWSYIKEWNDGGWLDRVELAMTARDTSRLYVSFYSDTQVDGEQKDVSRLILSYDSGESWYTGVNFLGNENFTWLGAQGWYDNSIAVHPFDIDQVYVGGIDIHKVDLGSVDHDDKEVKISSSQLTKWYANSFAVDYAHADHHVLLPVVTDSVKNQFRLINGSDGGLAFTDNEGDTWRSPNNGYNTSQYYGIDRHPTKKIYAGGTQDNGSWISGENPSRSSFWEEFLGGDGFELVWHANQNKWIGTIYNNSAYRFVNNSETYVDISPGNEDDASFYTRVSNNKYAPDHVAMVDAKGVWLSDEFGDNWQQKRINHLQWPGSSGGLIARISLANPQVIWTGNRYSATNRIFVSRDLGQTFNPVAAYDNHNFGTISEIETHPYNDSIAYLLFSYADEPKILRTKDYGDSWEDISGFSHYGDESTNGFPNTKVYSLLVHPHQPNVIWAGTSIGIFESINDGQTWHYADNGLPHVAVMDMKVVGNEIVIGTHGRGVWSVEIPLLSIVDMSHVVAPPIIKKIEQNFDGGIQANVYAGSAYDSLTLMVGETSNWYYDIAKKDEIAMSLQTDGVGELNVLAVAYVGGKAHYSLSKKVDLVEFYKAKKEHKVDFEEDDSLFTFDPGYFKIEKVSGFESRALHTVRPYPNRSDFSALLRQPVVVKSQTALLTFDEVTMMEPGESNAAFPTVDFYDYVVVEGRKSDGEWSALVDGWDSRAHSNWLNDYEKNINPNQADVRLRVINLLDKFNAGDTIMIRFRVHSDPYVNGWGWMIDNIKIQYTPPVATVEKETEKLKIYPNPAINVLNVSFTSSNMIPEKLEMVDLMGRQVVLFYLSEINVGTNNFSFDISHVPAGSYYISGSRGMDKWNAKVHIRR